MKKQAAASPSDPHLCQPDGQKSCAWCCGLYNFQDLGREGLIRRLRARTETFASTDRTISAILHFSDKIRRDEQSQLADPDFYSCEFVGFVDPSETRVGCMLHPLALGNNSIDWRGLSHHGAMACQGFFCRAFRELSSGEKKVILKTVQDWYLYGLVISDVDFTKGFFRLAEERFGRRIDPVRLLTPGASELLHDFFHWKIDWPFRKPGDNPICAKTSPMLGETYDDGGEEDSQPSITPIDRIFRSLGSEFRSAWERQRAKQMVEQLFSSLARIV